MYRPLEILLVEDNEGDVEMTRRALSSSTPASAITVANNGNQGLDCLNRQGRFAEAERPQLILLDINMPRMDGKAFLKTIKADDEFKAIPVVMFTSSESPTDIRDCFELYASAYVVKPFDGVLYADRLRQIVSFWGTVGELPK